MDYQLLLDTFDDPYHLQHNNKEWYMQHNSKTMYGIMRYGLEMCESRIYVQNKTQGAFIHIYLPNNMGTVTCPNGSSDFALS